LCQTHCSTQAVEPSHPLAPLWDSSGLDPRTQFAPFASRLPLRWIGRKSRNLGPRVKPEDDRRCLRPRIPRPRWPIAPGAGSTYGSAPPRRPETAMDRKYQIFVSSTYKDLRDERNEVIKACLNMGNIPVGMEMFNAADEEQWAVITRTIDQCDYYVVVVAHRYGCTTSDSISFTEKEYDYAISKGVPVLGFVISDSAAWPTDRTDSDQASREALTRLKAKIKQRMIRFWSNKDELRAQFVESLSTTINTKPRRGWVRAPEVTDVDIAQTLSNLAEENARLRKELDNVRVYGDNGNTNAIMHALKLMKIRASQTDEYMTGDEAFPLVAKGIRSRDITRFLIPHMRHEDVSIYIQELHIIGLIQQQSSIVPPSITPLGGMIYARLLAEEGV
jgi:hypothetical protein